MNALSRLVRAAFFETLGAIDIRALTRDALLRANLRGSSLVIAVGKASRAMSRGAKEALATSVASLLVVAPKGQELPQSHSRALYMHASHPLPDQNSVRAARLALSLAERASQEKMNLVVLVSGGASSLMALPHEGISLEKKRQIISTLLRAGAPIADLNVVRRHLSRVKGGALLVAANGARVVTVLVSDVLSNSPWDIGSGPSVFDPTTTKDAERVLRRYKISNVELVETAKKPRAKRPGREVRPEISLVASPETFAHEFFNVLSARGFTGKTLSPSDATADALVSEYVQIASKLKRGEFVVRAAEPQVKVTNARGRGGRASHLAALIASRLPGDVVFLAGATDGQDGSSDAAGAIVTRDAFVKLDASFVAESIARSDTATLHEHAKTAIFLAQNGHRATGQNFSDVHAIVRAKQK